MPPYDYPQKGRRRFPAALPGPAIHLPLRPGAHRSRRIESHLQGAALRRVGAAGGSCNATADGHRLAAGRIPAGDGFECHRMTTHRKAGDGCSAALPGPAIHLPLRPGTHRSRRIERHLQGAALRRVVAAGCSCNAAADRHRLTAGRVPAGDGFERHRMTAHGPETITPLLSQAPPSTCHCAPALTAADG